MELYNNVYGYFADLVNKLSLFNKKLIPLVELNASFENYKKSFESYFKAQNLISLKKKGDIYSLYINNTPKTLKRLVKAQEWLKYDGNVVECLKELGFPNNVIENTNVKLIDGDFKKERDEKYLGFVLLANLKSRISITNDIYKVLGNIDFKTEEVFIDVLQKNNWLKKQFSDFLTELKNAYTVNEKEKPLGEWIKAPLPKNNEIVSLFQAIKRHQKLIKGCWAVKYTGEKCLLDNLSCKFLRKNPEICKNNKFECPPKGCGCKNAKSCSKLCSNLNTPVPFDITLVCIKGTFWLAAQDYMNTLFDVPAPSPLNPLPPPPKPIVPVLEPVSEEDPVEKEEPDTVDIPVEDSSSKWVWILILFFVLFVVWMVMKK